MRTVRVKRNTEAFLEGQKVEVVREEADQVWLKGKNICDPMKYPQITIEGPILAMDVEDV